MTLEEQALKLYPPLSCYEKEPIDYNRRQAACREAWLRAKREDAAENERLRSALSACQSWIERWTSHVGNCKGLCTCGRTAVLYDAADSLTQ